jgi:hypothetical protein
MEIQVPANVTPAQLVEVLNSERIKVEQLIEFHKEQLFKAIGNLEELDNYCKACGKKGLFVLVEDTTDTPTTDDSTVTN